MSKIAKLDKAGLTALRAPLQDELNKLAEKFGLTFELGGGTYEAAGSEGSFKLIMKVNDPALREAAARERWNANCRYIGIDFNAEEGTTGLRPEDFGTEFVNAGVTYRTNGINPGRSKYCVSVEVMSGPKKGRTVSFDDRIVPHIRRATDAALAKAAA